MQAYVFILDHFHAIILANVTARAESTAEQAIKKWIAENYGAISRVAREAGVTPQTAWYCAFNKRASKDLRVERALKALGCPLIQKLL